MVLKNKLKCPLHLFFIEQIFTECLYVPLFKVLGMHKLVRSSPCPPPHPSPCGAYVLVEGDSEKVNISIVKIISDCGTFCEGNRMKLGIEVGRKEGKVFPWDEGDRQNLCKEQNLSWELNEPWCESLWGGVPGPWSSQCEGLEWGKLDEHKDPEGWSIGRRGRIEWEASRSQISH